MAKRFLAHIRNQWIGTLALFIALATGGAYAAEQIQKNSIGAPQIKKNAVGTSELKDDKTTGKDVDESSLGQVPSAASARDRARRSGDERRHARQPRLHGLSPAELPGGNAVS